MSYIVQFPETNAVLNEQRSLASAGERLMAHASSRGKSPRDEGF